MKAERALLNILGLAARAGSVVSGTDRVRSAVRDGKAYEVLLAADASPTQRDKLVPLLEARGVAFRTALRRDELGVAIGRAPVSAVGITNRNFARRVGELIAALPALQDQAIGE